MREACLHGGGIRRDTRSTIGHPQWRAFSGQGPKDGYRLLLPATSASRDARQPAYRPPIRTRLELKEQRR